MESGARERILATAVRLFFSQGYTQTGINQLIDESEVAKRTFYAHFASKEQVGVAYLEFAAGEWLRGLRGAAEGRRSAQGVVRALFEHIEGFAIATHFRGCGMLNMASEFAEAESQVREQVAQHKAAQRALIRELLSPFGVPPALADQVHVLIEGAIASAAGALESWPIRAAAQASEALLEAHSGARRAR